MAEELPTTPGEKTLASEIATPGEALPANQPQPVTDSRLAAILQKKDRGETLTPADRGYLGSVKKRGRPKKVAAVENPNPLFQPPPVSENPLFEAPQRSDEPAPGFGAAAVDSVLIKETADALLSSADYVTKQIVGYKARKAGADADTVAQYESAVALKDGNRKLMVENSEPVVLGLCNFFGCTPDKLADYIKNSGFIAGAVAHAVGVTAAIRSIDESRREREAAKNQKPE